MARRLKTARRGYLSIKRHGFRPSLAAAMPVGKDRLTGRVGNSMGWFGQQGERYFSGFTAGLKHRGCLEASVCQNFTVSGFEGESRRL